MRPLLKLSAYQAKAQAPRECAYCGATEGLRVHSDGGMFAFGYCIEAPTWTCEECFTGSDDGPSFDDLVKEL